MTGAVVVVGVLVGSWAVFLMASAAGHRRQLGEWPHRDEYGGCCNTGLHRSSTAGGDDG